MKTTSLKVYPRDLARLRARCRPGQTPAGALAELLDGADAKSEPPKADPEWAAEVGSRCSVNGQPGTVTEMTGGHLWVRLDGWTDALPFARRDCAALNPEPRP